ncbi:MAG: type II toxin-antitoxin system Phd/YefM family antitoxin [Pseudonocardia sp.]|nr:type II toxin-antitoxin system Phd/YefM family antitoxin [Pseudonocardia sp.]
MSETTTHRAWQVQEAKQQFSEMLRAVERDGPQIITRHGEPVAVILDAAEYKRLAGERRTLADVLLAVEPLMDDEAAAVFDEIEAERKRDRPREIDLGFAE